MLNPDVPIKQDDLTNDTMFALFHSAFMKPERDSDGDVSVRGYSNIWHYVSVRERNSVLSFDTWWPFPDAWDERQKDEFIRRMNRNKVLVRFQATEDLEALHANYDTLTNIDMTPEQIMWIFRRYDRIVDDVTDELADLSDQEDDDDDDEDDE